LNELVEYLLAVRRPVTPRELYEHFEVDRSTIHRMLTDLENGDDVMLIHEYGKVWIDRATYLNTVKLNLHELLAVFLAARLLARYSDKPNPHAVKALRKMSIAFDKIAPRIAAHIERTSARLDRQMTPAADEYLAALQALTQAWADGVRVRLVQREHPEQERLFEPYFVEPSAVGYSSYVIGFDHLRHDVRTFKIERLARVTLTADTYTIPAAFDPYTKLAGAWGVNWGDGSEAQEVVLRFAPGRASARVQETNWHETQRIEPDPGAEGGCILRITVGSTQEMKPWIRQWGCDCEVLAPPDLRREIGEEMRRAGALYDE
jgi:predicted DNA-binding transcriptional regulator YafY